ncbi:MAG TPA: hypothetical protein VGJ93_03700 [Desulfuromonadaceae bacterium]|jgi:outer membrane protein assembly factor BamD (BamD/ComL family)
MKFFILAGVFLLSLLSVGCSGQSKAQEMLETARFEEKQHNIEHATQLYQDIVRSFPGSPSARDALTRLELLKRPRP